MAEYCDKTAVKDRLLINTSDTQFDTALDIAIVEADRTIDIFLKPYTTVPLTGTIPDQIAIIAADFACSIFKRRLNPQEVKLRGTLQPDMINDTDGSGWFAAGLRKLQEYIKSYYALAQEIGSTLHNPDIYLRLFNRGIITAKEARQLINDTSGSVIATIEATVKTEELTQTTTRTIREDLYATKRQKSFAFVESDPDTFTTYKKQDDEV